MTREDIQVEYIHTTGEDIINSQGEPDIDYVEWLEIKLIESRTASDGDLADVSICLTKEEESKQIEAISSLIRGLAKDNSTVAIGVATIGILNAFTRSINRC